MKGKGITEAMLDANPMTRLSRITSPRATIGAFALLAAVMLAVGLLAGAGQQGGNLAAADGIASEGLLPLCLGQ